MPVHYITAQSIESGVYTSETSGATMFFREAGEGEKVVVMVHGLGSNSGGFKKMEELLSPGFRTVVVDLPGYGRSTIDDFDPGMKNYAGLLSEFIEHQGYEQVILTGHSMGGQVAITLAQMPEKRSWLRGLFLIAPAGVETFTPEEKNWFMQYMTPEAMAMLPDEQLRKNFDVNFASGKLPEDAEFMVEERLELKSDPENYGTYLETVSRNVHAMLHEPVADHFDKIRVPVWVVYGKQDYLIPNRILHPQMTLDDLKEKCAFPNEKSRFFTIDNGGHFLTWDQPGKLVELIEEFSSL